MPTCPDGEKRNCCYMCACFMLIPVFLGCFYMAAYGEPDLKRLLEEERHHVETICRLISANKTEARDCTYWEDCGNGYTSERKSSFQCLRVWVSYNDSNSSIIISEMLRSYQDAVETDFECSAYECEDPSKIFKYFRKVNEAKILQCFYHPERLEYVYFDTANHSLVIFIFVLCILLIVIPLPISCYLFIKTNKKLQCFQICFTPCCDSNSQDNITERLKNDSNKNCKRLVKKANVNREDCDTRL